MQLLQTSFKYMYIVYKQIEDLNESLIYSHKSHCLLFHINSEYSIYSEYSIFQEHCFRCSKSFVKLKKKHVEVLNNRYVHV
jgi:hypothetical protein